MHTAFFLGVGLPTVTVSVGEKVQPVGRVQVLVGVRLRHSPRTRAHRQLLGTNGQRMGAGLPAHAREKKLEVLSSAPCIARSSE